MVLFYYVEFYLGRPSQVETPPNEVYSDLEYLGNWAARMNLE